MNCDETYERVIAMHDGALAELERHQLDAHLEGCADCRATAAAVSALRTLRDQPQEAPPAGLFARVMRRSMQAGDEPRRRSHFWLGAGVGAAAAASVMVAIMITMTAGPWGPATAPVAARPAVEVALGEPRNVTLAIEMERALADATITVRLSGGVELDGYAGRRELSWRTDLEAGVNRLTLPVVAVDGTGGQLLVQVDHGDKQRRFTMDLPLKT